MTSILFIGDYFVGKTSLINYILKTCNINYTEVSTNEITYYNNKKLILIDTPGLNINNRRIEQYTTEIIKANYVFIVMTQSNYNSLNNQNYLEYCYKLRNYKNNNIVIIINKFDEIANNLNVLESFTNYFNNRNEVIFIISVKYLNLYPDLYLLPYIQNIKHTGGDKWLRKEIKKKLSTTLPYNRFIESIKLISWECNNYLYCNKLPLFYEILNTRFLPIKKYGKYITNINIENIYLISSSNILKLTTNYILHCSNITCAHGKFINFNLKIDNTVEMDYAVLEISDIMFLVKYSNLGKYKIIDYEYVELNRNYLKSTIKNIQNILM